VAFTFAGTAEPLIKEIPYVGNFIGESCELAILAAFAVVFAAALLLSSLFTPLLSSAIKNSVLGPIDAIAGFLFGVARGGLLVAVGFLVLDRVTTEGAFPMVDDSRSAAVFERAQSGLEAQIPTNAPDWILVRYNQLVGECGPGQQPSTATDATTGS
jgi:membrane protein required for colicin V production